MIFDSASCGPCGKLSAMPPRSVSDLIAFTARKGKVKYLYFWGHQPQRDGTIGRSCLSQWWPARFTVGDQTFVTAEHYMMWRKALLFDDVTIAQEVLVAKHPHRAKTLGRQVRGFDQAIWEAKRYDIVAAGSIAKFSQHDELKTFLAATGDRILVEASPVDRIWGIGLSADDPRAGNPAQWRGSNLLGFALMDARTALFGKDLAQC